MSILLCGVPELQVFNGSYENGRKYNRGRKGPAETAGNIVSR